MRVEILGNSHWHPDHTMGRRVWETRNGDLRGWPREAKRQLTTDVYLPAQVARDFRNYLGAWDHLEFMASRGWVALHELADGETVELDGVEVRPFRLAEDYVCHLEEIDGLGYDDLQVLARRLGRPGLSFAFDGLRADV